MQRKEEEIDQQKMRTKKASGLTEEAYKRGSDLGDERAEWMLDLPCEKQNNNNTIARVLVNWCPNNKL